ncbi:Uncharacterised protein [Staphylococcus aureus]|nr:Uncharacterised protein [Staphylococcus aureus]
MLTNPSPNRPAAFNKSPKIAPPMLFNASNAFLAVSECLTQFSNSRAFASTSIDTSDKNGFN